MALTLARGSRAFAPSTASDAIHRAVDGVFMKLPSYSRSREGEGRELGCDVSNGSHTARSRPVSETSESMERAGEGRFRPSAPAVEFTTLSLCGSHMVVITTTSTATRKEDG